MVEKPTRVVLGIITVVLIMSALIALSIRTSNVIDAIASMKKELSLQQSFEAQLAQRMAQLEDELQALKQVISTTPPNLEASLRPGLCHGRAHCFAAEILKVVSSETMDVGSERVRLALIETPKTGQPGSAESMRFVEAVCPVGSPALVDEDDGQISGNDGSMLAIVYCQGALNLNKILLESGHAVIDTSSCQRSEYGMEPWAKAYGC